MGWGSPEDPTSQAPWEGSPAWGGITGTQGIGHLWPQRWLHFREEKSHFPSHQCGRSSEYSRVFKGKIGVSGGSDGKESKCQCRRCRFDPWVGKIPWRRERQPTPVFLPGESHEQRSLVGYSSWGHKELDTTEQLSTHTHKQAQGRSVQFSSVAQSCPTLCHPIDCSMPGFPIHHQLPDLAQMHVH